MSSGFIVAVNLFDSPLSIVSSPLKDTLSICFSITVISLVASFPATTAFTIAVPSLIPDIFPFSSTVKISLFKDSQVTVLSSVVFSGSYTTVSCFSSPLSNELSPVILIPFKGATTVYFMLAVFVPTFAVTTASPTFLAVTCPLSTLTTSLFEDSQVTVLSSVVSSGSYVTVKVSVSPTFNVLVSLPSEILLRGFTTLILELIIV